MLSFGIVVGWCGNDDEIRIVIGNLFVGRSRKIELLVR